MQNNREIFRAISGYANYEVSNHGRVRDTVTNHIVISENKKGYRLVALNDADGNIKKFRVHRLVACAFIENPHDLPYVDHIDGNKSNNLSVNLRWCTPSQNMMNRGKVEGKTSSQFKGVTKVRRKWRADIQVSGKRVYLGYFQTEHDAARAYNDAARMYHKDFAKLNDL